MKLNKVCVIICLYYFFVYVCFPVRYVYMYTHMLESPLQFYVNHLSSPNVTAYGPGLSYGVANKLALFTVCTEEASEGRIRQTD